MQCSATALLLIGLQAFTEFLVFCTLIVSWGGICRKKSTGRLMLSPFHRLSCSQHLRYFSLKFSQNACILHFVPLVNSCLKALLRPNKPILKHSGEKAQWRKSRLQLLLNTTYNSVQRVQMAGKLRRSVRRPRFIDCQHIVLLFALEIETKSRQLSLTEVFQGNVRY